MFCPMQDRPTIRGDYKPRSPVGRGVRAPTFLVSSSIIILGILFVSLFGLEGSSADQHQRDIPLPLPLVADIGASLSAVPGEPIGSEADPSTVQVRVARGDSLARIFARVGLTAADVHAVVTASPQARQLSSLRPGELVSLTRDPEGTLVKVNYSLDEARTLEVYREDQAFASRIVEHPIERRISFAEGTITTNLFNAAREAGLSDGFTMTLAERIFGWDIDFALEIRQGDSFRVLYDEVFRDGERIRDGAILAAEFVNQGRTFRAVYFVDDEERAGYYAPDGRAMRKAFLRAPLDFTRISSHFNPNRRHPVLNTIRAHRGIDYAAPTGTEIRAAGDGRVTFRGVRGGYGNTVEIQHGGGITTLYAHLSRFESGVTAGARVRQGQRIGRVGMTGLATGPHLHYEFRLDGTHRNPLTVRLPDAAPLPERYREQFRAHAIPLLTHLEALSIGARQNVASADDL